MDYNLKYEADIFEKHYPFIIKTVKYYYQTYNCYKIKTLDFDDFFQDACIAFLLRIRKKRKITCNKFVNMIIRASVIDTIRKELKRVKTLMTPSRNKYSTFIKKQTKAHFVSIEKIPELEKRAYAIYDDLERKIIMNKIINHIFSNERFNPKYKLIFLLRYKYGWTYEMIGSFFDISSYTIPYYLRKTENYIKNIL